MFQFGFNMFHEISRPFKMTYRVYSVAMLPGNERQDVERGGKIIMPPSALEQLTRLNIEYPMIFKLTNKKTNRITHSGVLEFVADEGKVYLPHWMMSNLALSEGDFIMVESVSLPVATFSKFQPLSSDFLDITNAKAGGSLFKTYKQSNLSAKVAAFILIAEYRHHAHAMRKGNIAMNASERDALTRDSNVLENCLRNFSCLTTGDVVAIKYNSKVYELCVLETKPGDAVIIIECDMNVEFAAPVGYKEEEHAGPSAGAADAMDLDPAAMMPQPDGFVPFAGAGNRLDGKKKKNTSESEKDAGQDAPKQAYVRGIPDYEWRVGTLRFIRSARQPDAPPDTPAEPFQPFKGEGFTLRTSKAK